MAKKKTVVKKATPRKKSVPKIISTTPNTFGVKALFQGIDSDIIVQEFTVMFWAICSDNIVRGVTLFEGFPVFVDTIQLEGIEFIGYK